MLTKNIENKSVEASDRKDIKAFVNIKRFLLGEHVQEDDKIVKVLREYNKTGDAELIRPYIESGEIIEHQETHNMVVDAGFEQMIKSITGERVTIPQINYGLLGTGTPNVIPGATQLVTEAYRKTASSASHSGTTGYIDFFYTAAECSGTYTEFGNVIDGTASANSGYLFSYVATGGWVKTTAQSLYVACEYGLANG